MIQLDTALEGKRALYGEISQPLREHGFDIGGNWDFDQGMFDSTLASEGSETVYLRLPFDVEEGMMDEDDAMIVFKKPFVIKHVANIGLEKDGSGALTATGIEQFQSPKDKDAPISHKKDWVQEGKEKVNQILEEVPLDKV
ncbi:YugN family protein [Bacillus thermotolerans]|uniref:YugN family protein n=1 Tax=Bacillus thermotolerans TaxID=1221996 RepID=UPI000589539D|nr:YugN family protein [Bacillus thermotolerans]KKB43677.1 hypothetical protein QY96_00745 [Bacillus thermotolerans]